MERLPRAPSLLTPPPGLTGDFDVAATAPELDFAFFPNQWDGARLWSAWGDAICASDGRFYASIGDHAGPHGTTYVYRVAPDTRRIDLIIDYNAVVGASPDRYTPGKIHAPICEGRDRALYVLGYRGSIRYATAENGFQGDWLLRYSLADGRVENLGIPVPGASAPTMAACPTTDIVVGLSAPGKPTEADGNRFFAYDYAERRLRFAAGPGSQLNRAVAVAADGKVFYDSGGRFMCYDPVANKVTPTEVALPGDGTLRAASTPGPTGVIYCFSKDGVVFAFDPKQRSVSVLVKAFVVGRLYITSCELSPDGRYLYYIPSAHGKSWKHGTALVQLDVVTKRRKVLAFLNATVREQKNYNLGGTYGLALSKDGSRLFVNFNGAPVDRKRNDFGLCAAMIVHIPASERRPPARP